MAISQGDGSITLTTAIDESGIKDGFSSIESQAKKSGSKIGKAAGTITKAVVATAAATTAAVGALLKSSVEEFAEYEQLVGGVETLFKNSAEKVMKYANEAYRTAGMSANEYMANVTSFSASLLNSLGGDTEAAADIANNALISISDNANKMGSDIESVTMAFQGFAKQQYMLLDNLKLGYGGTKTEMQRLLKDAKAITGVEYNIDNLADVYTAIGVIQEKLDIAGTTAKEASTTTSGAAASMKAAWKNVLAAVSGGGDLDRAIENLVDSVATYFNNIVPVVERALSGIGTLIEKVAPDLVRTVAKALIKAIPALISAIYEIIVGLIEGIYQGIVDLFSGEIDSLSGKQAESINKATGAQNAFTNAVEDTNKELKKSLASFDDISILADAAADAEAASGLGTTFDVTVTGDTSVIDELVGQTEDIKENTTVTVSAWDEFYYEMLGKVAPEKFANLSNSISMVKTSAKNLWEQFDFNVTIDPEAIAATAVEIAADGLTKVLTIFSGGMDIASSLMDDNLDATGKAQGAWEGLGRVLGGIYQNAPDFVYELMSAVSGQEITEDWFVGYTEGTENLYSGLSTFAAKSLDVYSDSFKDLNKKFTTIKWNGEIITPETVTALEEQMNTVFGQVESFTTTQKESAIESLNALVAQGFLTEEQAQERLQEVSDIYDNQAALIGENKEKIMGILEKAASEERTLTKEESDNINNMLQESNAYAAASYTQGIDDRKQFIDDYMNETDKWDSMRLSQTIQMANKLRDEKIAEANQEYDDTVANADRLYNELGIITESEYKQIIREAANQRDRRVNEAVKERNGIVTEAQGLAGDISNIVDTESGVVLSKWEVMWNGMFDSVKGIINKIIDVINGILDKTFGAALSVADWFGFDVDKDKVPKIPKLATGAVIPPNREFLAVLGDQKSGVNVEAPLDTIVEAFNLALAQNGGYNGGNSEIVLELDGRELGRAVVEQGAIENRRVGTRLVIA